MKSYLKLLDPRSLTELHTYLGSLVRGRLWLKIIIALFLGIGAGAIMGPTFGFLDETTAQTLGNWAALPGNIFLNLIQMIVVPLVFTSVITGLASTEDMNQLKTLGVWAVIFFIVTTALAIVIGIGTTVVIKPGTYISIADINNPVTEMVMDTGQAENERKPVSDMPGLLSRLLPDNPLSAMVEKDMLKVVLFAVIFGIALLMIEPRQSRPLLELFHAIQEISMTVVKWAMVLAPYAVFGLMAQTVSKTGLNTLLGLMAYVFTVITGLFLLLLVYLAIVTVFLRRSPTWFLSSIRDVMLLAFSTSSSAAVMPLSMKTAEEKLKVKPSVSQFIIPLGATINMNGTALYQGAATVFLAQVYSVDLSMADLALIVITTTGASIGSPATPGVGIVILAMVLQSVGIPAQGVALILGVDRILDMCRTAINVTGDLTTCLVMDRFIESSPAVAEGVGQRGKEERGS